MRVMRIINNHEYSLGKYRVSPKDLRVNYHNFMTRSAILDKSDRDKHRNGKK